MIGEAKNYLKTPNSLLRGPAPNISNLDRQKPNKMNFSHLNSQESSILEDKRSQAHTEFLDED